MGRDYRGYADAALDFLDDDVGSIDNGEFSYSDTENRVRLISGDPRVVQIVLAEPLAEESVNELVLEFAGEEFPFADANSYSTRQFLWEQSWLSDNAPSLSSDCFATTLPLGGTAGVCLRTTEQTCPPTASSSAQRCPAPASAQASAEAEIIFVPLIARFRDVPEEHDGSTAFTLQLAFSEPIETTEAAIRQMLMVTHGTVTSVRQVDNRSDLWEIRAIPHSNADVSMSLLATTSCDADNAICTADGRMLLQGVAVSVPRAPLTARFESLSAGHDGSTEFALQLAFSEPIWLTEGVMRTQALTVTGGRVTSARRVNDRSDRWEITIQPNANDVRISLLPTISCDDEGAVCTRDGRALSNGLSTTVTGPAAKPVVALQTFALYANYPNPFNAETQMTYALPEAGAVELAIYNVRGQRVRTLVQGVQAAGRYQIVWAGRNDTGSALASGVYLSRLASTQGVRVRRLLLIK